MHPHALNILNALAFLAMVIIPSALADGIANPTVPDACKAICSPVVQLTTTCNVDMSKMEMDGKDEDMDMTAEEDKAELDCICNNKSFDVGTVMGLCSSCLGQNAGGENVTAAEGMKFFSNFMLANDLDRIMSQCSLPMRTYAPSATSILSGLQVEATQPAITMMAGMDEQRGAVARLEVATGSWCVGMVVANLGLGVALAML